MNDPAVAVKDKLVAEGVGTFNASSGWSVSIGQLPATPDTVVLVNQSGGRSPFPHLLLNFPSIQVIVRGKKSGYQDARAKMKQAIDKILGMSTQVLNADTYRSCNQLGDVIYLGQDENERPMFSANFWFIVEPATGDNRIPIS